LSVIRWSGVRESAAVVSCCRRPLEPCASEAGPLSRQGPRRASGQSRFTLKRIDHWRGRCAIWPPTTVCLASKRDDFRRGGLPWCLPSFTAIENRNDALFVLDHGERRQLAVEPVGATL
jgi:hypothetical protein